MSPQSFTQWLSMPAASRRPLVMGILNVTPDSFSDGGAFASVDTAVRRAAEMISGGADVIDIGGESTRPGAFPVDADEQCRRVLPVITAVRATHPDITISIDTTQSSVAAGSIERGATMINDVSAGRDDSGMFGVAVAHRCPIILMHRRGTSRTMQKGPTYADVNAEVREFLLGRVEAAADAGIDRHQILLDPGIGFGKTTEHDLSLLRQLPALAGLGQAIVIGVSRKKFIGTLLDQPDPRQRAWGTAAAVAWAVASGAAIVRVHDVAEMMQVVTIARHFRPNSINSLPHSKN